VFSVGVDPRLYNEDYRPARIRTERALEMAVEWLRRDAKRGIRL
jgi:hypothetical protein